MATKKRSSDWESEMEGKATKEAAREKARGGGGGASLSMNKGMFSLGGEKLGKKLRCVILNFSYLHSFFDTKYKEGEVSVPSCFAISEDGEDMEPHTNSGNPEAKLCEKCPNFEWGSGRGRGKACQERRRLAIVHVDDVGSAEDAKDATIVSLNIAATAVKGWAEYIHELAEKQKRPYYGVITEVSFDPDVTYIRPVFTFDSKITSKDVFEELELRREEALAQLMSPYSKPDADKRKKKRDEDEDAEEAPRGKRAVKKDDDEDEAPSRKRRASRFG